MLNRRCTLASIRNVRVSSVTVRAVAQVPAMANSSGVLAEAVLTATRRGGRIR